jgi:antitoxin component YwqK of YwqJK toxin-antitoxin module
MKRVIILSTGLLIFTFTTSYSCVCELKPEFRTEEDLAEYNFISLVKILKIDSIESRKDSRLPVHQIEFQIIELFKGDNINNILVDGGHKTIKNTWTSCDLGENVGEEWVIFAYTDKLTNKLLTHSCTRTFRYKKSNGYRYKGYGDEITAIDQLNSIFVKAYTKPAYSGAHVAYYPNGQKELKEFYKNDKLHGQRLLWYPDAQLESSQNFNNGKRDGEVKWYSENGQLISRRKYRRGFDSDTTISWHFVDTCKQSLKSRALFHKITEDSAKALFSKIQISSKQIYNKQGEMIYSCSFMRTGTMDRETFYTYKRNEKKGKTKYYHPDGAVKVETYSLNDIDFGTYTEWDQHGNLIKSWEYDNKGRQIKESIKLIKR